MAEHRPIPVFRPKPVPVPEPDGFTPEQLAAQLKAEAIRKLGDTDYVVTKAVEQARTLSQGWLAWRDTLRAIANGSGESIPQEPDRWSSAEPTEPEHHFADLMLADETEAPLLPAPDALMADYGPVGTNDITGDLLLDAFEHDEAETAAIVQTLSALKLKHLSEQLNVERARLDREHQATGIANPRSASIDRLLGLLTRRGEV